MTVEAINDAVEPQDIPPDPDDILLSGMELDDDIDFPEKEDYSDETDS